jgi:3'-phosphoadenosine 5'-phosphosulfate sulfotransferase (PAPS reductase)/FAD synthetase
MSLIGNMSMDMKRCSRCVLPEVFHNITFDNEGVCSVCYEWDKQWKGLDSKKLESKFNELLLNIKKNKGRYDCIVAFSGGKDSMYALYLLKRRYNINPLAVNLNNYFQTENVKEWISFALKKLEVDLITESPKMDNFFTQFKKKINLRKMKIL